MTKFTKGEVKRLLKGQEVAYCTTCSNCTYYQFVTGWHSGVCTCRKLSVVRHAGAWILSVGQQEINYAGHCKEFHLSDRVRY